MSRETWNTIIHSKTFYVRTYRTGGTALIISLLINLLCGLGIYYIYFHEPIRDYYATSGVTPPVKLSPLNEPNYSSIPLLEPDPIEDNTLKAVPE